MYMDEPPLVGSDPETSIAVPEQLIRIDIAVREQSIRIGCASNRVRFDVVADELHESCAVMAINSRPSSALLRSRCAFRAVAYRVGGPGFNRQSPDSAPAQSVPELSSYKLQTN